MRRRRSTPILLGSGVVSIAGLTTASGQTVTPAREIRGSSGIYLPQGTLTVGGEAFPPIAGGSVPNPITGIIPRPPGTTLAGTLTSPSRGTSPSLGRGDLIPPTPWPTLTGTGHKGGTTGGTYSDSQYVFPPD